VEVQSKGWSLEGNGGEDYAVAIELKVSSPQFWKFM
jgi:hypothetical protein